MIDFPDHFIFFYFILYFKICKYDKDKQYFLFPFCWKNEQLDWPKCAQTLGNAIRGQTCLL